MSYQNFKWYNWVPINEGYEILYMHKTLYTLQYIFVTYICIYIVLLYKEYVINKKYDIHWVLFIWLAVHTQHVENQSTNISSPTNKSDIVDYAVDSKFLLLLPLVLHY